jgi:hypothetical protein
MAFQVSKKEEAHCWQMVSSFWICNARLNNAPVRYDTTICVMFVQNSKTFWHAVLGQYIKPGGDRLPLLTLKKPNCSGLLKASMEGGGVPEPEHQGPELVLMLWMLCN